MVEADLEQVDLGRLGVMGKVVLAAPLEEVKVGAVAVRIKADSGRRLQQVNPKMARTACKFKELGIFLEMLQS